VAVAQFQIRKYAPDDFETLCEIDRVCYEPLIAYSPREMRSYLRHPASECVVAQTVNTPSGPTGQIAGFCITAHEADRGYIITIDVLETFRKQGVGSALLAEAEKQMAAGGIRVVGLETATDNVPAIAFWEKHGYRKRGVRKAYYPNGRDAFAMMKSFAP
jgi:ribosomal-protein-alanine N-acetyltransferase